MDIAVVGDYAYLAVWDGLLILNIMNPTTPLAVGYYHTNDGSDAVRVQYPHAFLLTDDGIEILDISRPWSPTRVGFYGIDDRYDYWSNCMELEGTHVYIATWQGLLVVDVSDPPRPVLSSLFAHREGMVWYNHIKIAHPLAVVDGVYPQVLDISSPQQIRWLGEAHQQNINGGMAITPPHFYGATPSNGVYSFSLRACEMNHRRPLGHP
jgi:hypothetical protein